MKGVPVMFRKRGERFAFRRLEHIPRVGETCVMADACVYEVAHVQWNFENDDIQLTIELKAKP